MAQVKIAASASNWWYTFPDPRRDKPSAADVLQEMAAIGFTGTEINTDIMSLLPWVFRQRMRRYGIQPLGGVVPVYLLSKPLWMNELLFWVEASILKAFGGTTLPIIENSFSQRNNPKVPMFSAENDLPPVTEAGWQRIGAGITRLKRIADRFDLRFCLHPHWGTNVLHMESIDRFMDSSPVAALCVDTAHLMMVGIDPVKVLDRYIDRTLHFHLQDLRLPVLEQAKTQRLSWAAALEAGLLTTAGHGNVDYEPIIQRIQASNYQGWAVLEGLQDPVKYNPADYSESAYQLIHRLSGWT